LAEEEGEEVQALLYAPLHGEHAEVEAARAGSAAAGSAQAAVAVSMEVCLSLLASLTLLAPIVLVLIGRQQVQPLLERGKQLLEDRSSLILGGLSLALAAYLGWQGWTGLGQFQVLS